MMSVEERYLRDPLFKSLVDVMTSYADQLHLTPTEMREAAMLAQIHYEEQHPRMLLPRVMESHSYTPLER